jgi:small-conductance mechanosensitive channel
MPIDQTDFFLQLSQLYDLVIQYVYSWVFVTQAVAIALAVFVSHRLALATGKIPDYGSSFINKLKANSVITFYELCFYSYMLALIWIEQSILIAINLDPWLVTIALVMIVIWVLGRSSLALAAHSSQARLATFVLWLLVLLSLFGNSSSTLDFLRKETLFDISLLSIIKTAVVFTILLWAAQFFSELSKRKIIKSKDISPSYKVLYTKISRIALFAVAGLISLNTLGVDTTSLEWLSGAFVVAIGLGLQRVFANFVSGVILLLDKSIKPGDALEVDGVRGIVDHMNARYVSILTQEGKNILVPNESMVTEKVHNWSYENSKVQMRVTFIVAYGSDLTVVQTLVEDILKRDPEISQTPPPACFINDFTDIGIKYDLRFWIDGITTLTGPLKHNLLMCIWEKFKEHNIEMAQTYPDYSKGRGKKVVS